MVSLIVGFPGSGKSYYAVEKIYNLLSKSNKKDSNEFDIIYTNIGGIKFDYFPDSKIEFKKLVEDELIEYLKGCHALYEKYKNFDNVDEYLIEYSKEKNFYNALIVFDECHDFFTPQDRVKIFWLTYHRHLHHEIILLTQNKSLINSKYRAIPEQFIEAQPRSKKIFSNTLNYKFYASFAMRKTDHFNSMSLKTKQEIFDLYQSGNKSNQKSIVLKFIFILGFGAIFALILFYILLKGFTPEVNEENIKELEEINKKLPKEFQNPNLGKNPNDYNPIHSIQEEYYNVLVQYESNNGYLLEDRYYRSSYFKHFLKRTKSKILIKDLVFEMNDYKMERIILRTSKKDLQKYFYIEDEFNNFKPRRTNKSNNTKANVTKKEELWKNETEVSFF